MLRAKTWLLLGVLFAPPIHAQSAPPLSVAVLDVAAKVGIDKGRAEVFAELLQDHLRNELKFRVIGRSDVEAMLGLEKLKDVLACKDESTCMAEIGGALGVDEILVGSLAKMGSYLVVSLKRINPQHAKVLAQVTRKLKGATDDDLIEAVAPMVRDLYRVEELQKAQEAARQTEAGRIAQAEEETRRAKEAARRAEEETQRARDEAQKQAELRRSEEERARQETQRLAEIRAAEERVTKAEEEARRSKEQTRRLADVRAAEERAAKAEEEARQAKREARRAEQELQEKNNKAKKDADTAPASGSGTRTLQVGAVLGVTGDARAFGDGVGATFEISLQPLRWLEVAAGFASPKSYLASLRFWLYRGAAEVGVLTRFVMYEPTDTTETTRHGAGALGLAVGVGKQTNIGVIGGRIEPMFAIGEDGWDLPVTLAGFWRW